MHQESFEGLSMRNTLLKDSQETTRKINLHVFSKKLCEKIWSFDQVDWFDTF